MTHAAACVVTVTSQLLQCSASRYAHGAAEGGRWHERRPRRSRRAATHTSHGSRSGACTVKSRWSSPADSRTTTAQRPAADPTLQAPAIASGTGLDQVDWPRFRPCGPLTFSRVHDRPGGANPFTHGPKLPRTNSHETVLCHNSLHLAWLYSNSRRRYTIL